MSNFVIILTCNAKTRARHFVSEKHIILYVIIFENNQKVTLGLFHFIGPANTYTYIHYPLTMALPGLADWSAFLGQV